MGTNNPSPQINNNNNNNNFGMQMLSNPVQQPQKQDPNLFKFKAYETEHLEIWMECKKETND